MAVPISKIIFPSTDEAKALSLREIRTIRGIRTLLLRDVRAIQPQYKEKLPSWPGLVLVRHQLEKTVQFGSLFVLFAAGVFRHYIGYSKDDVLRRLYQTEAQNEDISLITRVQGQALPRFMGFAITGSLLFFLARVQFFGLDPEHAAAAAYTKSHDYADELLNRHVRMFQLFSLLYFPFFRRNCTVLAQRSPLARLATCFTLFTVGGVGSYALGVLFGFCGLQPSDPRALPYMSGSVVSASSYERQAEINKEWRSVFKSPYQIMEQKLALKAKQAEAAADGASPCGDAVRAHGGDDGRK